MRRALVVIVACASLVSSGARAIDTEAPLDDPQREAIYQELIHEVRCLVCQNQTIGDSNAPLAADLRREIRRLLVEGKSESDIKTFLLDRYGDFVLYKPRFMESTALLWLAPALLLLVGAIALARIVRRRMMLPGELNADENASTPESGLR